MNAGYQYRGNRGAMPDTEVQARVDAARAKAGGGGPPAAPVTAAPALKGAVKVDGFPSQTKYPFQAIASDGGVWKLDPAAFGSKPLTIRAAASKWAIERHMKAKVVISDGQVYVQFTSGGAR